MRLNRTLPDGLNYFVCTTTVVVALMLSTITPAAAQEWTEYQNIGDGFRSCFRVSRR